MLQQINKFFTLADLELNTAKCGSLSMINNRKEKYVEPYSPDLDDDHSIPAWKWEDSYKYLGVCLGRERKGKMEDLTKNMKRRSLYLSWPNGKNWMR